MTDPRTHRSAAPAPLATLTTLRLGGPARTVIACPDTETLVRTVGELDRNREPVLLIAGGSNLVIADDGFDGTAVHIAGSQVTFGTEAATGDPIVTADAGVIWDDLVATTVEKGFGGLECLSGIPGSVGATPVQNVGAYGVEIADVLVGVELYDRRSQQMRSVVPTDLELGYRTSNLKHRDDAIVVSVTLRLNAGPRSRPLRYGELSTAMGVEAGGTADAAEVRATVLGLRRGKGMVLDPEDHDTWSAGSFFTNPIVSETQIPDVLAAIAAELGPEVSPPTYPAGTDSTAIKLSAGWLIERAGFGRGYPGADAPARLSTKHTLALTNRGTATTADLLTLAREVRDGVHRKFGVFLVPEPVLVNCSL